MPCEPDRRRYTGEAVGTVGEDRVGAVDRREIREREAMSEELTIDATDATLPAKLIDFAIRFFGRKRRRQ